MSICIKCQRATCSAQCAWCSDRGDVRTDQYNEGYQRGLAEQAERVRAAQEVVRVTRDWALAATSETMAAIKVWDVLAAAFVPTVVKASTEETSEKPAP